MLLLKYWKLSEYIIQYFSANVFSVIKQVLKMELRHSKLERYCEAGVWHYCEAGVWHYCEAGVWHYCEAGVWHYCEAGVWHY